MNVAASVACSQKSSEKEMHDRELNTCILVSAGDASRLGGIPASVATAGVDSIDASGK